MKVEMNIAGTDIEIGLDRFVLSIPYPKKLNASSPTKITPALIEKYGTEKAEFVSQMHYIKNLVLENLKHHVTKTQSKDIKRYNIFFDEGGLMCVLSLGFCFGTGVINIEVNPSKLSEKQWLEFKGWVDIFFGMSYQSFYSKAVVSHAEFFVDVSGADLTSLVLLDNTRRITTIYEGNIYLGKRESPRITVMYDKAKQLKIDAKLVRVEARINPQSLRLQDLVEHTQISPFGNDLVVHAKQLQLTAIEYGKAHFANHIKELGLNGSGINKHSRKVIFAKLQQNPVNWWKPELFWSSQREMLKLWMPKKKSGPTFAPHLNY